MKVFLCCSLLFVGLVTATKDSNKHTSESIKTKRHTVLGLSDFGTLSPEFYTSYSGFQSNVPLSLSNYYYPLPTLEKTSHVFHSYPVEVEKKVAVPYAVKVPVEVPKPYAVHITKQVPVPYPVHVEKKVAVPYEVKVPVEVPKPYPVHITKHVPVPYPVTVEKKVAVPYEVKVPVEVPKPYPVHITKHVPVIVKVPEPYPVHVPQPYPVHTPTFEAIEELPVVVDQKHLLTPSVHVTPATIVEENRAKIAIDETPTVIIKSKPAKALIKNNPTILIKNEASDTNTFTSQVPTTTVTPIFQLQDGSVTPDEIFNFHQSTAGIISTLNGLDSIALSSGNIKKTEPIKQYLPPL